MPDAVLIMDTYNTLKLKIVYNKKTMKQKTIKSMLLLPCAVIVVMIGITTYFACSADDEWEGSPEYLHTHAPMLTRAGVDVGGGDNAGDSIWALVFLDNFTGCTGTTYIDGCNSFTATVTFNYISTEGRIVGNAQFNQDEVDIPNRANGPGNTVYELVSYNFPHAAIANNENAIYPNRTTHVQTELQVTYRRYQVVNGDTVVLLRTDDLGISVNVTSDVEWRRYKNNTLYGMSNSLNKLNNDEKCNDSLDNSVNSVLAE